ncbi:MAG: putative GTP-binding protein HflX [Pseudobdellovibrio sp.]|nr:putative GTP-binding protein HflX [Pseudobdellovibrio sp.]
MSGQNKPAMQKAILVGIQLPKMEASEVQSSLQELSRLVTTLGYQVIGQISQKRGSTKSAQLLGDGKMQELAKWTGGTGKIASLVDRKKSKAALKWEAENEEELIEDEIEEDADLDDELPSDMKEKADIVIVDCDLSPSQLRNLESAAGVPALDRTGVIIEIFSRHAKTKTARLQVEIARLAYLAPRMREANMGGDDREGGGGKGVGESAFELDKRRIRDRIKELKTELASISNEHEVRRARRSQELTVALVGYTNAGKSSLMRALTGSDILVADKLFATLDTTIRPLYPESRPKLLISDTVGFIKKLPHDLVASFKSTLDEALHASLLLYVVDSSDPSFRSQLQVTQSVLAEVGVGEAPFLLVLNKRDNLTEEEQQKLQEEFPDAIQISTRNKEDLQRLRDKVLSYFESDMVDAEIFIPYLAQSAVIGDLRQKVRVLSESYSELGLTVKVRAPQNAVDQFQQKIEKLTPKRR